MNSFDFLIIYLTCGAPLGVFYFLQNRKNQIGIRLWLKTFFTFVFWLPFGFRLLENKARKKLSADKKVFSKSDKIETTIFQFQKRLEAVLQNSDLQMSVFEFREVFERYIGLTIAVTSEMVKPTVVEKEIFRIANVKNLDIGAICLNRRNLQRLTVHQAQARRDFIHTFNQLVANVTDRAKFVKEATDFLKVLKDTAAQSKMNEVAASNLPDNENFTVNHLVLDL